MDDTGTLAETTENKLIPRIEALLFVASTPVQISQIAEVLLVKPAEIEAALNELQAFYTREHGLRLQWHAGKVQLTTAPEFAADVENFLGLEFTTKLSRAALETLVIIAYKQPITRPAIDAIRGVNSDGVVRSILSKGLIEESGRAEGPGRPILYTTTPEFLQYFGLASIGELPAIEEAAPVDESNKVLKE